jgi:hypothetical protein
MLIYRPAAAPVGKEALGYDDGLVSGLIRAHTCYTLVRNGDISPDSLVSLDHMYTCTCVSDADDIRSRHDAA